MSHAISCSLVVPFIVCLHQSQSATSLVLQFVMIKSNSLDDMHLADFMSHLNLDITANNPFYFKCFILSYKVYVTFHRKMFTNGFLFSKGMPFGSRSQRICIHSNDLGHLFKNICIHSNGLITPLVIGKNTHPFEWLGHLFGKRLSKTTQHMDLKWLSLFSQLLLTPKTH